MPRLEFLHSKTSFANLLSRYVVAKFCSSFVMMTGTFRGRAIQILTFFMKFDTLK